jgi:hypothetical protein
MPSCGLLLQLVLLVHLPSSRQEVTPANQQIVEASWQEVRDR